MICCLSSSLGKLSTADWAGNTFLYRGHEAAVVTRGPGSYYNPSPTFSVQTTLNQMLPNTEFTQRGTVSLKSICFCEASVLKYYTNTCVLHLELFLWCGKKKIYLLPILTLNSLIPVKILTDEMSVSPPGLQSVTISITLSNATFIRLNTPSLFLWADSQLGCLRHVFKTIENVYFQTGPIP